MEKIITYFGQTAKVGCDEKCDKAWGMNKRPRIYRELGEKIFGVGDDGIYPDLELEDIDDYAYCSDSELGIAPEDPGTYEDGHGKPVDKQNIPNKWCIRECERCVMSEPGKYNEPLKLGDFSTRHYNISPEVED